MASTIESADYCSFSTVCKMWHFSYCGERYRCPSIGCILKRQVESSPWKILPVAGKISQPRRSSQRKELHLVLRDGVLVNSKPQCKRSYRSAMAACWSHETHRSTGEVLLSCAVQ
ncbi:Hypothetical protein PAS_chr2-1_0403 [Komagataella phaffii GS115]|uniref:Uncharacterized protein n=1 Tax=Komagataella phaffii (strain GS115 / ATCC 20864) TaxID=644223 RepID=C4R0K0_KOMPG|nr:Hypothetical protein PAS_chr2-1_0403 [Komagataella phaffii GS115]CAH2448458.1 Conserved predicted protein [Komagataella phaffii CBS 7435]CAY69024.1 Hypothetical protein PAS_chr2-1_0403 [Komagataella phaffii GS115]